jgi:RHS repeat-associated protein
MGYEKSGNSFYFVTDGLSSVRSVMGYNDSTSKWEEVAYFEHDEYGNEMPATTGSSPKTWVGGLGVADDTSETNLFYMRRRHYDPNLGRFLNPDPIGLSGGMNLYNYSTNPVNYVDPTGLDQSLDGAWNNYGKMNYRRAYTQKQYNETVTATINFLIRWAQEKGRHRKIVGDLNYCEGVGKITAGETFAMAIAGATMQTTKFGSPSDREIYVNRNDMDTLLNANAGPAELGAQLLHEGVHLKQGGSRFLSVPILNSFFEWAAINEWSAREVYNEKVGAGVRLELQEFYDSLSPSEQKRYNPHGCSPFGK